MRTFLSASAYLLAVAGAALPCRATSEDPGDSAWEVAGELEVAAGHRSNPQLAAYDRVGSDLVRANLNVFAWRMPVDGWEWTNMADATVSRYFAGEVDDASLVIVRSESGWTLDGQSVLSVAGQWIHHDEVVDASSLDSGFGSVRARMQSPAVDLKYVRQAGELWEISGELGAEYSDFAQPLDDFFTYKGAIEARRAIGRFGIVGGEVGYSIRDFDTRMQLAIGGRPIEGSHLQIGRPSIKLLHELKGGSDLSWRVRSYFGTRDNDDNGPGWFDYRQLLSGLSASVDGARWRADLDLDWSGSLYRFQTEGFGNPPRRRHDIWNLYLRCERDFGVAWSGFLEVQLERSRSNDPQSFFNYDDTLVLTGLRWSR